MFEPIHAPKILEYQSLAPGKHSSELMFSLTIYFFAGFAAFMFTLACAALFFLDDDIAGQIVMSLAAAIGAIVTGRCVQLVWQLLCSDTPLLSPQDDRLVD